MFAAFSRPTQYQQERSTGVWGLHGSRRQGPRAHTLCALRCVSSALLRTAPRITAIVSPHRRLASSMSLLMHVNQQTAGVLASAFQRFASHSRTAVWWAHSAADGALVLVCVYKHKHISTPGEGRDQGSFQSTRCPSRGHSLDLAIRPVRYGSFEGHCKQRSCACVLCLMPA